jgi:tetratricopeptide (TPR) repeat protein
MGRWEESRDFYQRCLDLRRSLDDPAALAEALYNLSFTYSVPPEPMRDREVARDLIEECLAIFRTLDDRRGVAKTMSAIHTNAESGAEWERSLDAAREALGYFLEFDDRFSAGWAYHSIGLASSELGRYAEAEEAFRKGLELFRAAGIVTGVGFFLLDISLLEGHRGNHERASRLRGAAFALEQPTGMGMTDNIESYIEGVQDIIKGPLSEDEYERLQADGATMTLEEAVAYALQASDAG